MDPAARNTARQLGNAGLDALEAGEWELASEKLEAAYSIIQEPSLAFFSAEALEKTGRISEAAERYLAATRLWDSEADPALQMQYREEAQAAYERLVGRVPRITITVVHAPSSDVTIVIDNSPVAPTLIGHPQLINPGKHTVKGTWEGQEKTVQVVLAEGDRETITLVFEAPAEALEKQPSPGSSPMTTPPHRGQLIPPHDEHAGRRTTAWVAVGVGAGGLAVGTVFGALAVSEKSQLSAHCPDGECAEPYHEDVRAFRSHRTLSTVGLVGGMAAGGIGLTLLVLPSAGKNRTEVRADGRIVTLRRRF